MVKVIVWQVLNERVDSMDCIQRHSSLCSYGLHAHYLQEHEESLEHLFWDLHFALYFWVIGKTSSGSVGLAIEWEVYGGGALKSFF